MPDRSALSNYLDLLTGRGHGDGWLELRYRHNGGMRTRFYRARRSERALERRIVTLGAKRDVYVGCALRLSQRGDRDHISEAWVLWAECDASDAKSRLDRFDVPASLLIASGSPGHLHAYWALSNPVAVDALEDANRRLARAVGGDPVCFDATRILRPPGTSNHKYAPPRRVRQVGAARRRPYQLDDVVGGLPELGTASANNTPRAACTDPLLAIEPAVYVSALTGQIVGRDRKVSCPLHRDRTPSLHVYPSADRGWTCFGCMRGGSIYDMAAAIWHLETRGADFLEVKRRLQARFL